MRKEEIFDHARRVVGNPPLIEKLYAEAFNREDDFLANVMAIEAVYLGLTKQYVEAPLWTTGEWRSDDHDVHWVRISTGETVPVFKPRDGSAMFAEW
jgi:hypothetical protein